MEKTAIWTIATVDTSRMRLDDDDSEWRCSSCHKWQHGLAKSERRQIQRLDEEKGQLGAVEDVCKDCSWRLVSAWLVPGEPYPGPFAFPITFDTATLYRIENDQGEMREELAIGRAAD